MRTITRYYGIGVLSCTLLTSPGAALAQEHRKEAENDRRYQDARHHDEHAWNDHEDRAYRMWLEQRHHKYSEFDRLKSRDQQAYWDWRHNHSDAQLKIEIR